MGYSQYNTRKLKQCITLLIGGKLEAVTDAAHLWREITEICDGRGTSVYGGKQLEAAH